MFKKLLSKPYYILFYVLAMTIANPVLAGPLTKTKQNLSQFSTEIHSLAGVVFVIAGAIISYGVIALGKPIESFSKLIYGALALIIVPEAALWLFP